jgi:hypothetical protein
MCPTRPSGTQFWAQCLAADVVQGAVRLAALIVLTALPARAYRPFDGTDAAVAERGVLEVELGPAGYLREAGERFLVTPAVIVNLGVLNGTEVVAESRHKLLLGASGQSARSRLVDSAISVKQVLRNGELQDGTGPSIVTEIGLLLPAWHDDPGVGGSAAVIVSRKTPWAALHLNAAASVRSGQNVELFGSAIVEGPEEWRVRPVGELFVQPELGVATTVSALLGAIWPVSRGLSLDGGLRLAREAGQAVVEARLGLTFDVTVFQ